MFARIEQLSLRTKIVVPMVALSVLPAIGIAVFVISSMQTSMRNNAIEREIFDTAARAHSLEESLWAVETDLRFLSQIQLLRDLARARNAGDAERVVKLRGQSEHEFMLFSQGKRSFYQVRYIDSRGREVVRLNVEDGRAKAAPVSQLQDKSGRRYVKETMKLAEGELYISQMDLNIEHGRVEIPHRLVLRFGLPLFGDDGERTGILVLNLDVRSLFRLIEPLRDGTEAFLLDRKGTYLGYIGPSEENRERYDLAEKRELTEDFGGIDTREILDRGSAEGYFETTDELISIGLIRLTADSADSQWRLIVTQSRSQFGAPIRRLTIYLWGIIMLVLVIVARVGITVTNTLARPVIKLRKAMSQIVTDRGAGMRLAATGPANEIEALSREFLLMAQRLEEAQSRLQELQTGLAEADKLSTIGQLTRGVIQEISGPLTAIKNKIEAAGAPNQDVALETLRGSLLADVGRMESALRSFSHLAKTPGPEPEVTSLATVVKSAVTLVGPEIRHRGLHIEVEAEPAVPPIVGDFNQLCQLLVNLALNAADAKPKSERILLTISAVMSEDPDDAVPVGAAVKIDDDGVGIPTESLVKIWDPFFTTKPDSLGLGLPICRRIVEDHDGRIEVSSQIDHGTTVTVSFPMATAGTEKRPPSPSVGD